MSSGNAIKRLKRNSIRTSF